MAKFNPFQPNMPVHPGMFVGRLREIERLEDHLLQTKSGNPSGFLITGERGIGKTSLLLYASAVARGVVDLNGQTLNFLVISTDIDQSTTQLGLVRKIELGLRKSIEKNEKALAFVHRAWNFLQRVELDAVSIRQTCAEGPTEALIEEAAYSLAETVNSLTSQRLITEFGLGRVYDGVLLLMDETDNASAGLHLGSFLKLLLERLQRLECNRVVVGLAGLPKLRDVLLRSHESSLRLFEELDLKPLSKEETGRVIDQGIKEANEKNSESTSVAQEARNVLTFLAEGLPHFIQQFCFSAFEMDTDWSISNDDVWESALGRGGALDLIGDRYYRDAFYNRIAKESYRQVLRIMAASKSQWVTKGDIRRISRGNLTTLDSAIHALISRNIIVPKEGQRGVYKLLHRGFALWIRFFTIDPEEVKQLSVGETKAAQEEAVVSAQGA